MTIETTSQPSQWAQSHLNLTPDPVQAAVLDSNADRLHLCCTRQWGKSTIVAAKALHVAANTPNALVLFAAPSERQSRELLAKLRDFAHRINGVSSRTARSKTAVYLKNGSRIVALPQNPDTIRGYSAPALVVVDEAAFVGDALLSAITPSLAASNGALWLLSSPNGPIGQFYELQADKESHPDWHFVRVTAEECPRIHPDFLARERRLKTPDEFRAEYMCEFVSADGQVISRELLDAAIDPTVQTRF